MFAINILEKCLALVFLQDCLCFMVKKYIYWPAVCLNLVPSWTFFCENTRRRSLVCRRPAPPRPAPPPQDPPTVTQAPPPPTKKEKKDKEKKAPVPGTFFCKDVYNVFVFFLCEKTQNSRPSFLLLPPVPHLLFSRPSGVCVKCTLPWFFFIQYSVTCLCKFGLEKNKSFYETICPGNFLLQFMRWYWWWIMQIFNVELSQRPWPLVRGRF